MKNEIFEANPKLDCYYETADGNAFFTENAAKAHAKDLNDKTVKTRHRVELVEKTQETEKEVKIVEKEVEDIEVIAEIVEPIEPVTEEKNQPKIKK